MCGVEIAVVCVTHDSAALIGACVDRVRKASTRSLRVVIVDSGSHDQTVATSRSLVATEDVLELNGNEGYAAGLNVGMRHVRSTGGAATYVFLNPDVTPDPGALDALADGCHESGVGLSCPRLRDERGQRQNSLHRMPTVATSWSEALLGGPRSERWHLAVEQLTDDAIYEYPCDVGWATGGCLAVSAECARAVGEWDETLWMYEEEVDYCRRAADHGYAVRYVPAAGAVRLVGEDRVDPWRRALMTSNRVRLLARRNRAAAAGVALALVVGEGMRGLAGRPESRAGAWAVLHRATPTQVRAKYLTGAAENASL
jgi:GT2 family glycosyltransferase